MASGTITLTKSGDGYLKGRIVWESTSNGSTKNNSTVKASLQVARSNTGYTTTGTWTGSLNIGGTVKEVSYYGSVSSSWVEVYSFSITKAHNSDGTGTCYIYGKVKGPSGTSMSGTSVSGSKTVTLDTIPRASSVTATAANIGSETKITISRNSSSFTHTLTYSFSGLTGTIATKTTSTSVSWTVPTTFYAKIPNAKSGTCTITCETFSGSTSIGTKTCTFKATAAESSCKPTLSPTVTDTNSVTAGLTGDSSTLIKYFSNAAVDCGAAARNSATLKSYKITCGGDSITTASGTFNEVESGTFTFTVTDSRGYSTTQTVKKSIVNYVKLTCGLSNTKFTTDGVISFRIKGNYFNGTFGDTSNVLITQYRYKESGGSYGDWVAAEATITNNTYTASVSISGLDYQKKYVIQARAIDELDTIESAAKTMSCIPIFDWGESDFQFNVVVKARENVTFKNGGVGIRGTTTDGVSVQALQPCNANNNLVIGYGGYNEAVGATNIYGNAIQMITNDSVTVNGCAIAENKVLWSGEYYMNGSQTITLSEAVSKQATGIVLVFSRYNPGEGVLNEHFNYHFVPKQIVALQSGKGSIFNMNTSNGGYAASKYLYIGDTSITGHDNNNVAAVTGSNGVTYNNNRFVLRYVIGV